MHPAIIIGTVRSLWTWLWGRYHVPQNVFLVRLEISFVERGIYPIAKSTVNELVTIIMAGCIALDEMAIFPLPLLNLTSAWFSSTPISSKTRKFRRFAYI